MGSIACDVLVHKCDARVCVCMRQLSGVINRHMHSNLAAYAQLLLFGEWNEIKQCLLYHYASQFVVGSSNNRQINNGLLCAIVCWMQNTILPAGLQVAPNMFFLRNDQGQVMLMTGQPQTVPGAGGSEVRLQQPAGTTLFKVLLVLNQFHAITRFASLCFVFLHEIC